MPFFYYITHWQLLKREKSDQGSLKSVIHLTFVLSLILYPITCVLNGGAVVIIQSTLFLITYDDASLETLLIQTFVSLKKD